MTQAPHMSSKLQSLKAALEQHLAGQYVSLSEGLGELTLVLAPALLLPVMTTLRDHAEFAFEQCVDVCGVDYQTYKDNWEGSRFAAVYHLLSIRHNWRLRVRVFAEDDNLPVVDSVNGIWPSVNWFEREAFDLYGIIFLGHPDLRRILTDYGFVGHPFRKDFPISGNVEMIYDAEQKRVVYQPVSIDPREITPRIIREENYGG